MIESPWTAEVVWTAVWRISFRHERRVGRGCGEAWFVVVEAYVVGSKQVCASDLATYSKGLDAIEQGTSVNNARVRDMQTGKPSRNLKYKTSSKFQILKSARGSLSELILILNRCFLPPLIRFNFTSSSNHWSRAALLHHCPPADSDSQTISFSPC